MCKQLLDGATSVHHTSTTDAPWDGPAAVAAMPNNAQTLTYCHAWKNTSDDADPTAKSSYKFPHHKADHGPANLAACRNGLSRLQGANVPEGDKADVKKHLQAHLDDAAGEDDVVAQTWKKMKNVTPRKDGKAWWVDKRMENGVLAGADLYLYDEIGPWGVDAGQFVAALKEYQGIPVNVRINSPGGDVFDGFTIFNQLQAHTAPVSVYVDGLAASAASFIAMAGSTVRAAKASTIMIHDGLAAAYGNASQLRELADLLDKHSDVIAGIYADKAGGTVPDWRVRMQAETWYTSDEALDAGLVDEITVPASKTPPPVDVENSWVGQQFRFRSREEAPPPVPVEVPEETDSFDEWYNHVRGAFSA